MNATRGDLGPSREPLSLAVPDKDPSTMAPDEPSALEPPSEVTVPVAAPISFTPLVVGITPRSLLANPPVGRTGEPSGVLCTVTAEKDTPRCTRPSRAEHTARATRERAGVPTPAVGGMGSSGRTTKSLASATGQSRKTPEGSAAYSVAGCPHR
jgi:hypothetical protein